MRRNPCDQGQEHSPGQQPAGAPSERPVPVGADRRPFHLGRRQLRTIGVVVGPHAESEDIRPARRLATKALIRPWI